MAVHNTGQTERRSNIEKTAMIVGAIFLLVGILGFIPGITTNYDQLSGAGHHSGALLLGIFQVSYLHNAVHLLFGVAGLAMARAIRLARIYLVAGGIIYLALWIYGLIIIWSWVSACWRSGFCSTARTAAAGTPNVARRRRPAEEMIRSALRGPRAAPIPEWLFGLVALIAVANGALLTMIISSRLAFGIAEQGLLPSVFGAVHPGRRTPWVAIIATTAVAMVLTLTGARPPWPRQLSCCCFSSSSAPASRS